MLTDGGPSWAVTQCAIKHTPTDFRVVEVDPAGVIVDSPDYALPVSEARPLLLCHGPPPMDAPLRYKEPLSTFVATDAESALVHLANGTESSSTVTLGTFDDKKTRAALRSAVRWHHPNLTTAYCDGVVTAHRDTHTFKIFTTCFGQAHAEAIVRASLSQDPQTPELPLRCPFVDGASREDRKAFHDVFHKACSGLFCAVHHGVAHITAKRVHATKRPRDESVYTHLVVSKCNVETQRMKELLSQHCGVPESAIAIAGMKDRRAITWQRVSLPGDLHHKLSTLPTHICDKEGASAWVCIHRRALSSAPIMLGELFGNRFEIVVKCSLEPVEQSCDMTIPRRRQLFVAHLGARMELLSNVGMLNTFGPQRFGRGAHGELPGVAILRGDWAGAVAAVLQSAPAAAREALELNADFDVFRRSVNPRTHRDAYMIGECLLEVGRRSKRDDVSVEFPDMLSRSPRWVGACREAIQRVPYHLRQLWLHAAQSVIFNRTVESLLADAGGDLSALPDRAPLVGSAFQQTLGAAPVGTERTICDVLSSLRIEPSVLASGSHAGVPLRGSMRECVVKPSDGSVRLAEQRDEHDASVVWVQCGFTLPSSSYATVLIKELVGCEPVDAAL